MTTLRCHRRKLLVRLSVVRFLTCSSISRLVQIATKLGDVQAQPGEAPRASSSRPGREKAELVVFPELSLTGYVLQDLVASVAHRPVDDDPVFQPLLKASRDIDVVVGFVDEDSPASVLHCVGVPFRRPRTACPSQAVLADLRPVR